MNIPKIIKLSLTLIWLLVVWFGFLAVQPIRAMPHGAKSAIPLRAVIAPDVFTDDNTVNGNCTLREAIIAANTNVAVDACPAGNVGGDTITLSAGTYNLTLIGAGEDAAATGDLDILEDLTITGVSSTTTIIDASGLSDRVFHIRASGGSAHFENVQIVNGQTNAGSAHGGGIFLDQGALTVSDSRIANNQTLGAGSGGGGIFGGGGAIVLTNTEILSNSATALGGGIQVVIAPLVGSNIRVENNTAVSGGGGINADNVTLNSSAVISNRVTGGSAGGAGINAGTLVMTDTIVADNTTGVNGSGGGVAIALDSTITGGAIYNNTANNDGAGIYVGGGTTTINGTQIYTNTASSQGGGLYINSGSVQMLSGQIDDNEAQNGGGVLVNSGATFSHTGGTIAYNRAPSFPGGGLWVGGTVLIDGGQVLSNSSGNVGGGVLISSGGVVELVSGQIDYNQSSGAGAGMWVTDGAVFTQTGGTVAYNSTTNSGAGLWVQGRVWLNGGQVLGNSSTSGNGGGLYLSTNGQVTIDGGEVVSNSAAFDGGGFYLNDITNTLTVNSGTIGYNVAQDNGGGVYIGNGTVTLNGGQITANSTSNSAGSGGGVFVNASTASLIQNGGDIAYNQVAINGVGGGVAVLAGFMEMTGGRLFDNFVDSGTGGGGGLWLDSGSATLSGGQIISNSGPVGGGIFLQSGAIDLNGTDILSNTTTSFGAGVYHWGTGTMTHTNASIVAYNSAQLEGGGVYIRFSGAYLLDGGQIISNSSATNGGGVYLNNVGSVFNQTSGLIGYNSAGNLGGAVYLNDGTATITNSRILTNTATTNGGAIYQAGGSSTVNNSCIVSNSDVAVNYVGGTSPMLMTGNWWGTADGPSGGGATGSGDSISSNVDVDFSGYLTSAPFADCPTVIADLAISKTVNPTTAAPGDTITYTIAFTNNGPSVATGIIITDTFPVSVTIPVVNNSGPAITQTSGYPTYSWQVVDMSAGQSGVITLTGQVALTTPVGTNLTNTVEITGTGDTMPNNNSSFASFTVAPGNPPFNITIVPGSVLINISQVGGEFTAIGNDAQVGVNNIRTALAAGNVTVNTGVPGTGTQPGNITVTGVIDFDGIGSPGRTLTLSAANDIAIDNTIYDSSGAGDALNLNLEADVDNDGSGGITIAAVTVDSQAAITMTANTIFFPSGTQIAGTDTLRLQPREPAANFSLGGETINSLVDGFSQITIGRDDSSGQISLAPNLPTFFDPVLIQSPAAGGTIDTNSDVLSGQDNATITLLADQTITAFRIENPNRAITVTSLSGNIIVNENITTTNLLSGGPVVLSAATTITVVGVIETQAGSGSGDGGDVTIWAGNDVELSYITSGTGGTLVAGDVQVTGRYVRLTNTTNNGCSNFSGVCAIWSEGSSQAGVITITHQGNGIVPFIVGDATTNGANGALFGGAVIEETPAKTYYGSYTEIGPPNVYIVTNAPPPDVAISKTVNPTTAAPGDPIAYTIAFTNTGPIVATGIIITDTFPVSVTIPTVNNSGPTITQTSGYPNYSWQVADMSAGQSGVITINGQVVATAMAGLIDNLVEITATGDITPNNVATATVSVLTDGPGGVANNLELWLKADIGTNTTTDGAAVTSWTEQSPNGWTAVHSQDNQPTYHANALNFNPAVTFGATGLSELNFGPNYVTSPAGNTGMTIFAVVDPLSDAGNQNYILNVGGAAGNGYGVAASSDTYHAYHAGSNIIEYSHANGERPVLLVHRIQFNNSNNLYANSQLVAFAASTITELDSSKIAHSPTYGGDPSPLAVGRQSKSLNVFFRYFQGDIAEIVVYAANIDGLNRAKVESHLAIKYGLTLINTVDYVAADGTIIYNSLGSHSGYIQDIAGIGYDIDSQLLQLTSRSVNTDSRVIIAGNSLTIDDGEYLVWGNDDGALTASNNLPLAAPSSQRFSRIWRVQETGDVGNVTVSFELTGLNEIGLANPAGFALLVDVDPDFSDATMITGASVTGSQVSFSGVDFTTGDYFSLGYPLNVDVAISKTVNPTTAVPGETITYTIAFTNNGSSIATNVVITDTFPAGIVLPLSIISSGTTITPIPGPIYAWTVDPLLVGQGGTIMMTSQVAASAPAGTIINTAEITATGDITPANNSSSANLTVAGFTPTLVINNVSGSEGGGSFIFTLELTAASFTTVTVDYITQDQTATAGADYQGTSGTLTWPPGTLTNTIAVVVLDDTLDEATETFGLLFSNLTNAQFATTAANVPIISATGTILDDDFYPDITLSDASGLENSDWLTFTVNLNAATNLTVTVNYATQDDTATAGLDYLSVSGSLIIPPGELSRPLTVTLVDDLLAEDNETFSLTLTAASLAYIVDGTGLGTIIDNETGVDLRLTKTVTPTSLLPGDRLTYTLIFSNAGPAIARQVVITDLLPAQLTGVSYQATGVTVTPTAGLTYVWSVNDLAANAGGSLTINGQVQPTIIATTLNNTAIIDSQTTEQDATNNQASAAIAIGNLPQLSFEPATYQVDEAAGRVTVTVQLDGTPASTGAAVRYTTQDGTALAGLDYLTATGRLTFTAGLTQQQFTVPISDDQVVELEETVPLSLFDPQGAVLNLSTAILSIIDNDTAGVQIRPLSLTVTEAGATDRYNLRLASAPQSPVTITIQPTNGHVNPLPGEIIFRPNNWQISQTVIISAVDDLAVEGRHNDSLIHSVSSDDPAYAGLTGATVEVLIGDNDFPMVSFSQAAYLVAEGSGSAQITVQLSDSPWLTATVDYQTTPGSATPGQDYRPVSSTLRFLPGTTALQWAIPILDDTLIESPETVNLSLLNPVNSSLTTPLTAVLTISDADQLPPLAVTIQDPAPVATGNSLTLTVTPSDNTTSLTYRWQFGDGTPQVTTSQLSVNHAYLTPGIYTVILTATDGSRLANDTTTVIVDDPLQGLTATHTTPTLSNNPISFTASITQGTNVAGTGGQISYTWDFGDGTTGVGPQPTHSYASPGTYQVTVIATNSLGSVTTSITIVVGDGGSGTTDDLLAVRHFVSASQLTAGEFMTYQTIVLNVSQQAATSVVIIHDWPADAEGQPAFYGFINEGTARELSVAQVSGSQTTNDCTLQGAQLRCQIEELPAGSRVTINLMLSPRLTGTLVSRVTATAAETDLTPANNLAEVTTEVLSAPSVRQTETGVTAANRPSRVYLPVVVKP